MIFINETPEGRYYLSSDVNEAYDFCMKYNGIFIPDYEESLKGNYVVRI